MKSLVTHSSSMYSKMPFMYVSEASLTAAFTSSRVVAVLRTTFRSTTDTSAVGTRNARPVSFPATSGITSPTALAAPVDVGMMFPNTLLPIRQSFVDFPSTVFCLDVAAWIVDIRPFSIPNLSSCKVELDSLLYKMHLKQLACPLCTCLC